MKIKTLMDSLNKDEFRANASEMSQRDVRFDSTNDEKVVYIENDRLDAVGRRTTGKELVGSGEICCADQSIGDLLVSQGKLNEKDIDRIIAYQRQKGLYFGEAGVELGLVKQDDILKALSSQFGYSYGGDERLVEDSDNPLSKDMVMASVPFSKVAEEFRSIRAHLLSSWLRPEHKSLAILSPGSNEGRSYFAANIALAFSQLGRSTLLIDANLRSPRQHEIFDVVSNIGLSKLLAGRVRVEELDMLPDKVSAFPSLSILGAGPPPPNPSELLGNGRFLSILNKLENYFEVIIIDSPSAAYRADILSIAPIAGSALLLARRGYSRVSDTKALMGLLTKVNVNVVGAVLNQY